MPRKPRIEFSGAMYHVMSRGNRGDAIYLDDHDREIFIETLAETCGRTGWFVHAYVLMGNHYHLLIETPEPNLVVGMKWLQGTYTQRFNSRHKVWGHLLQGRYKALLVQSGHGEYFSTVGSYIHLNPARAKLFDLKDGRLTDFVWSSYPLYFKVSKRPKWLCVDRVLGAMGLEDDRSGRTRFRNVMQKRVLELLYAETPQDVDEQWAKIRRGWFLGDEGFKAELLEKLNDLVGVRAKRESFEGDGVKLHDEQEAEVLLKEGLKALSLKADDLGSMKKSSVEKCCLAWIIRKRTCVPNGWIKEKLHMGKATNFAAHLKRVEERDEIMKPILAKLKNINISD